MSFHHPSRWHVRDYGLLAINPFGSNSFDKDSSGVEIRPARREQRSPAVPDRDSSGRWTRRKSRSCTGVRGRAVGGSSAFTRSAADAILEFFFKGPPSAITKYCASWSRRFSSRAYRSTPPTPPIRARGRHFSFNRDFQGAFANHDDLFVLMLVRRCGAAPGASCVSCRST